MTRSGRWNIQAGLKKGKSLPSLWGGGQAEVPKCYVIAREQSDRGNPPVIHTGCKQKGIATALKGFAMTA